MELALKLSISIAASFMKIFTDGENASTALIPVNGVKMEKPKKSLFVYLIGIYLFLMQSVITAPLRKISNEYSASTGNVNYQNNQLIFLISILMIVLSVQIIRYRKIFFYIGSIFFILSSTWLIYLIIFVYKKYFTWIDIVLIINISCSIFLLSKKNIEKCNLFSEYYKQKKQIKEMQKRL